ncbi:oxidoreductaseshort chain dehydrogenase/reductase family protein, partial [Aphelenchoides avenae]
RNGSLGHDALNNLTEELGDKQVAEVRFHQLDITEEESCRRFAEHLEIEHGGLDVLVNNAGFAFKFAAMESEEVQADVTIAINYYGTKLVSDVLLPLMRSGGRVVNVCSQAGLMAPNTGPEHTTTYSQERIERFRDRNLQVSDVDAFVEEYKQATRKDNRKENGFPDGAYRVSKAAEIALTMVQARELKDKNIVVNACCPGYVDTDMTNHKGHHTIDEGADTPVYLATEPNLPSGLFWYKRKPRDWLNAVPNFD